MPVEYIRLSSDTVRAVILEEDRKTIKAIYIVNSTKLDPVRVFERCLQCPCADISMICSAKEHPADPPICHIIFKSCACSYC